MKRRELLAGAAAAGLAQAAGADAPAAPSGATKTLYWAFPSAETGFDPAQISDLYSNYIIAHIFEPPLCFDFLARPAVLKPLTATALPTVSSDYRRFTVSLKRGILFQDDPAFKGQPRELTAADYVYGVKRLYDPRWKSPSLGSLESAKLLELPELRKATLAGGRFDYDREVAGIRALDRYTFEVNLAEPDPRFINSMTDPRQFGAVAREVVEAYADDIMAHPVGTGPFRLVEWRRSSKMVLVRSPTFRHEVYDAEPPPGDARGREIVAQLKGRRLPMIDRVEVSVIDEDQPRWLAFLSGQQDLVAIPLPFFNVAAPRGQLAPSLQRRGIHLERAVNADIIYTYFNMEDPVVGGMAPEKVALRRAIALGYDTSEEIRVVRRGQMVVAQSIISPNLFGYEPDFVSEMSRFDRAAARALLDTYGYVDRDGDGWREQPDGSPLELVYPTPGDQIYRAFNEVWKRQMDALGIRIRFDIGQWPEQLKAARAGKLMMWGLGGNASEPDADTFLVSIYGPQKGQFNFGRFDHPEVNRLYEKQRLLPDGPERLALLREIKRLLTVYMPIKVHGHRIVNDLTHPWLIGYRRHPFGRDFFKWVDIDVGERERRLARA
jgi:ABC-type transport system substrate-binding protein